MSVFSSVRLFRNAVVLAQKYPIRYRFRILVDYLTLHRDKGLTTKEYYDFEFEEQGEEFRYTFLGLNEQRYYLDYLNPIKYYSLARNKYLAHKVLENVGIRKTTLYCYYQPEACYIASNECAGDLSGVLRILEAKGINSCVIKTTESSHGDNVWVINDIQFGERDAMLTRFDGNTIRLSEILSKEPLIFESVVHQTKQFAYFNETSVNTVRFMTTLYPDGTAKIIATFVKIGSPGRCVDNAGDGGNIDACIDVETGEIKYAVLFNGWRKIIEIDKHPDSGCQLKGVVIDNWQSIKEEVKRFQQAFPYCKAAGWDIAITDDGPVVIEINDFWDRTGQYFIRHGWRNEIRDCYIAWKRFWGEEIEGSVFLTKDGPEYKMYRQSNMLSLKHLRKIASYE